MPKARIAVIGGSGLYKMEGLTDIEEVKVRTPYGDPSDDVTIGTLSGQRVAFLPRHGRGHRILPSQVNSRANIWALKSLGVERIISVSACGSMREDFAPRHIVIPDQIFDRTLGARPNTFFGDGIVAHISFADPFCPDLSTWLYDVVKQVGGTVHKGGTFLTIEGPQFSTKGESRIYRQWGVDIIGMTAIPEAKLAREAEMCYATMAHVTDYDVWHETEEPVTVEMVIANLEANVGLAQKSIAALIPHIAAERHCACATALANAVITAPDRIPAQRKQELALLIGKYLK